MGGVCERIYMCRGIYICESRGIYMCERGIREGM